MIEIRIHGRGGQGGVTLAKLLAAAEHREGRSVQAFGIYAAERSGAPLQAFLRCDDQPIHNPNMIYEPDHIIVLDPTLIGTGIIDGLKPGGIILLNCEKGPEAYANEAPFRPFRVATVDATAIALQQGLGSRAVPIVNTALAGAMTRLLGMRLEALLEAFEEMGFHEGNAEAARQAYDAVRWCEQVEAAVEQPHVTLSRERSSGFLDGNTGSPPMIHTGQWAKQQPVQEDATPPCNFICPAGNDVQGFLAALASDKVDDALAVLLRSSPLPSVCGRVCPGFCMQQCNRREFDAPVNVRALERFAGDHGQATVAKDSARPERVAVIGSGPAGLAGAYHLARLGYGVSLFEQDDELGGLMRTGIPTYRLPRAALDRDIQRILDLGVEVHTGVRIDRTGLEGLAQDHDAVLVATGLQRLTSLDLGIDSDGVQQGLEFLDKARAGDIDLTAQRIIVVGGGNTAIDAARTAWRLGAGSVKIVYRRSRPDMPAISEEVDEAIDEGIEIDFLTTPLHIEAAPKGWKLTCQSMALGEPDASGRRSPQPVNGSEFFIECDRVILALGQKADTSLLPDNSLLDRQHPTEAMGERSLAAAGDLLTNEGTVTAAIGCGREMALRLHEQFSSERLLPPQADESQVVRSGQIRFQDFVQTRHDPGKVLPLAGRRDFTEVHQGLDSAAEARRCLSCGVCNACDRCVTWCPDGVLRRIEGQLVFDYDYCKGCGVCVTECSRAAIHMKAG